MPARRRDQPRPARSQPDAAHGPSEYDAVIDPDVDLHDPAQQAETRRFQWDLLLAIAVGGVLGAEARYGVDLAVPHQSAQFPWSTVVINASGCLLIGVLMVIVLELMSPHRLVRPFLGVGVLGGYTTYSTFALDVQRLLLDHRPGVALGYVVASLVGCGLAVCLGSHATLAVGRRFASTRAASS